MKYAMHNISSQLFVSKYQLYLPNREELKALIEKQLNDVSNEEQKYNKFSHDYMSERIQPALENRDEAF